MYHFEFYTHGARAAWDAFIRTSRNGVFLFERGFMDYHADRFKDASVIIRASSSSGKIVAVLPAHQKHGQESPVASAEAPPSGNMLISHEGLTFGGLVMDPKHGGDRTPALFGQLSRWLAENGYSSLRYKPTPHIYHRLPSEDDLYALHHLGARTTEVLFSSTLDLQRNAPVSGQKQRAIETARRHGILVGPCRWEEFWPLLSDTLQRRHGTAPVHTLDEIRRLAASCPQLEVLGGWGPPNGMGNRSLHTGAVLFHYEGVTHAQYLASSPEGFDSRAQHAVLDMAIHAARQRGQRWFSFGSSTTTHGTVLNEGLVQHKEMFGARTTILQTLEMDLKA